MELGRLNVQSENGVATVEFFHPASNSLPSKLLEKLAGTFKELSYDPAVRVVVFKSGEKGVFCSGASLDELLQIDNLEDGVNFFCGFGKVVNAMRKCNKPIIGRIQGKAVGGGVGLIAACDYAMATDKAFIKLSELSIGIGPFVVEPAISRKIGKAAMAELTFNPANWQSAYWGKEKGLYARVFEDLSEMDNEVQLLAEQLNSYAPEALQSVKRILWEGTENWDEVLGDRAYICGRLVLSETTKKALAKFKNKS